MRKVRNLHEYKKIEEGEVLLVSGPADVAQTIGFEVSPYGPCAIYFQPAAVTGGTKEAKPERQFVGWCDHPETFNVTVTGPGHVLFEPTGEAYVRHQLVKSTNPNPSEGSTFTRMERMGLHVDELGAALHRQAVLNRVVAHRENYARDAYQRRLEAQMEEMRSTIAALQPQQETDNDATETE